MTMVVIALVCVGLLWFALVWFGLLWFRFNSMLILLIKFTHSFICSSVHLFLCSHPSPVHPFTRSSVHPFAPSFVRSLAPQAPPSLSTRWVQKAQLTEARKAVTCIEFAPKHVGLRIATGSADGVVRVYEAIDVMNLNHWPMCQCFDADTESELGVTSLSWCTGIFEPPMLVVGGSSGRVTVWRFSDASRQWCIAAELPNHSLPVFDVSWAPNIGRSFHLIASSGKVRGIRATQKKSELVKIRIQIL